MKQVELAQKTGIVVSTIRQYELGFRKPKIDRIKEIADALGVPFDCLLEFDTEKCKEKNILICNAAGYSNQTVAELVVGMGNTSGVNITC